MDTTVEGVKQLLAENFKRKLSDSSSGSGNSPKRRPTMDQIKLPEDTPDWGRMLFDRINDLETSINNSVDFLMETVAEMVKETGDIKATQKEEKIKTEDLSYQLAQMKSAYNALHDKVVRLEDQSRRDNLLFNGFPEERGESDEDCMKKVYNMLVRCVRIPPPVLNRMRIV